MDGAELETYVHSHGSSFDFTTVAPVIYTSLSLELWVHDWCSSIYSSTMWLLRLRLVLLINATPSQLNTFQRIIIVLLRFAQYNRNACVAQFSQAC